MIVTLKNVTKTYRSKKAIHNLTLQIKQGSITGLIGKNGAGKTTLLKLIAGFSKASAGEINVFGEEPFDELKVSTNTIFIDDQMVFPETLTLAELIEEGKRFYPNWDEDLANRLFKYFKFEPNEFHHQLSKGKKSTFNFIFGLATRAALTILDEPTTGMDQATRKDFYRALLKDYLSHPRTIIISSHHLDEMEEVLEDIILIDEGELVLHTLMDDFRNYAIGVTGPKEQVIDWTRDKEIIYEENIGIDQKYVVVKNEYDLDHLTLKGFNVANVTSSNLAVYLTNTRGAIDDVFSN